MDVGTVGEQVRDAERDFSPSSVPGGDLWLRDIHRMSRNITPLFAPDADEVLFFGPCRGEKTIVLLLD